ncbi:MAG: hypothetical protein JST20_12835 [Bacteroidetes bacterium]|nr:hypothetical protein [Bacteroidota bacterium]
MLTMIVKKVCVVIKFIDTTVLFLILGSLFLLSFLFDDTSQTIYSILFSIIVSLWGIYWIALEGNRRSITMIKVYWILINIPLVFFYTSFLSYSFGFGADFPIWMFIVSFFGNIYFLCYIVLNLRNIGKNLVSLEKKREVKLEEYIGLSLALLPYIFAIPTLHSRIQRAIYDNEEQENS